jgi:hypothetical protein
LYYNFFLGKYVDNDQLVIFEMAKYFSLGYFPEPYFWGQSYLLPIEAYFASLIIRIGLSPDIAVSLTMAILFYTPFLVGAYFTRKIHLFYSILILATPFLLPYQYLMVAFMPRGFLGSISMGTLMILLLIKYNQLWIKIFSSIVFGITIAAYTPTILLMPILFLSSRNLIDLLKILFFVLIGWITIKIIGYYAYSNPLHIIYHQLPLSFSFKQLFTSLHEASVYKSFLYAFVSLQAALSLYLILLLFNAKELTLRIIFVIFSIIGGILIMLSTNKIMDFTESIFYSGIRFWLIIPYLFLSLNFFFLQQYRLWIPKFKYLLPSFVILILVSCLVTLNWLKANVSTAIQDPRPVQVDTKLNILEQCNNILSRMNQTKQHEYVLIEGRNDFLAYGCYPLAGIYVVQTEFERRVWLKRMLLKEGYSKISPLEVMPKPLKNPKVKYELTKSYDETSRSVTIKVTNNGDEIWIAGFYGEYGLALSYMLENKSKDIKTGYDNRFHLPYNIKPKESFEINIPIRGLADGENIVSISMVQELVFWFHDRGNEVLNIKIKVNQ